MADRFAEVDGLLHNAEEIIKGQSKGAIVALCEKVLVLLVGLGLAMYNVSIACMQVGVHPHNRYGLGIKTNFMHELCAKIVRSSFRWSACTDAICVEEDDSGEEDDSVDEDDGEDREDYTHGHDGGGGSSRGPAAPAGVNRGVGSRPWRLPPRPDAPARPRPEEAPESSGGLRQPLGGHGQRTNFSS